MITATQIFLLTYFELLYTESGGDPASDITRWITNHPTRTDFEGRGGGDVPERVNRNVGVVSYPRGEVRGQHFVQETSQPFHEFVVTVSIWCPYNVIFIGLFCFLLFICVRFNSFRCVSLFFFLTGCLCLCNLHVRFIMYLIAKKGALAV